MNDSFGGGFNSTQTNNGIPVEKKPEGIVSMVISQVLRSGEDGLSLHGIRLAGVDMVAIVRSADYTSTKITYLLEDHTGQISAHYWLEEGDSINTPQLAINSYARVFGSVRNTDGRKTLMLFRIEPLQSANELTAHLLEMLHARYRAEDLVRLGGGGGAGKNGGGDMGAFGGGGGGGDFGRGGQFAGGDSAPNSLNPRQQLVYDAIKNHGTDGGPSRSELSNKFKHMSETELNKIIDWMTSEGHIYTSIDSEHFLTTDG